METHRQRTAPPRNSGQLDLLTTPETLLSPKRPATETAGVADVFPYYAGFSYEWAARQLESYNLNPSATVLDPWNGSGTTTLAAQSAGLQAVGVDLNPVANVVARLRTCWDHSTATIVYPPPGWTAARSSIENEPLLAWFVPATANRLRRWVQFLQDQPSASSALGLIALFRVVRELTSRFEGSNPTWVRRSSLKLKRVSVQHASLDEQILAAQELILSRMKQQNLSPKRSIIVTGSATRLPISSSSIDAILTSPPYLTRIDYAVAYSRELALLGVDIAANRGFREDLMGTTMIRRQASNRESLGPSGRELIRRIAQHPSKASGGYYLKQVRQYMYDLDASLSEISRVAKPGAVMAIVVQDSYYKDVHIPLAKIYTEEAESRGWLPCLPRIYAVKRTLTQLNRGAQAYDKGQVSETVILLRRQL